MTNEGAIYSSTKIHSTDNRPSPISHDEQPGHHAGGVLPRIHRESTDASEYHIGGGGISQLGYTSN